MAMHKMAKEIMKSLGQDVDLTKPAGTYGMGIQQMIEIAKAVLVDAKVIIMDEPTSSLGEKEVEQLMRTCRELKARRIGIVFVSHKLEELFELCDRVEVIRDGQYIDTRDIQDWDNDSLIAAMVGRSLDNLVPQGIRTPGRGRPLRSSIWTRPASCTTFPSKPTAARSLAFPAWSARAVRRPCARSSARTRSTAERSISRERKSHQEPRARPSSRASPS